MNTTPHHVFLSILTNAVEKGFVEKDALIMGNFAFFTEEVLLQPNYQVFKEVMDVCLQENRSQEFNLLVASAIYQRAKQKDIGRGLEERLVDIYEDYRNGMLHHFCLLTDEVYFPEWVKAYEKDNHEYKECCSTVPINMG